MKNEVWKGGRLRKGRHKGSENIFRILNRLENDT